MDIVFRTRKLQRTFNEDEELRKTYGKRMARVVKNRLAVLESSPTLAHVPSVPPARCHQLKGGRRDCFAVDLVHPYRLLFKVANDPLPRKADGGVDLVQVTKIEITEVVDYHQR